ncbi:phosphoribosylformylglycinamidine synthase subunit PurS [Desulforamulus hydrothermalis]|uniref:Phosphoribosylformylglycinamidine synthase subunit PurS n=1 Tax=Desulforamulus hydrothermalis Lam5 = DSM 18033 TaxID=1121428 RepID=K8E0X0_9FIRM|nr:phosphoribosylformylglycinamidine synthase subunit PurS [Desulforamulus hydrothermalis]CCO09225.1 Phosphoribosylformylglycinamidine synthase,purS [Desulforamulus hydrothermalis Lam5 = DSM 18033]SHH06137.1 phosphoribosylformylglycinamidine synthase [Desulforamulus hydrothermalis Lam5 = DSM 18033]
MWQAKIYVTLRKSVLDPQGSVVRKSLFALGYHNVSEVRIGRYMVVDLEAADRAAAEKQVRDMCDKLLVNPVIEDYTFELVEV